MVTLSSVEPPPIDIPEANVDESMADCFKVFDTDDAYAEATRLLRDIRNYED
jgi:hypothetical protein